MHKITIYKPYDITRMHAEFIVDLNVHDEVIKRIKRKLRVSEAVYTDGDKLHSDYIIYVYIPMDDLNNLPPLPDKIADVTDYRDIRLIDGVQNCLKLAEWLSCKYNLGETVIIFPVFYQPLDRTRDLMVKAIADYFNLYSDSVIKRVYIVPPK